MEPLARSEALQAGQSLGKFYLVRLIGEGGTSRIFKALQQPINRTVALKIPSFAEAGSVLSPDEFLSEATLMAKLDHPNVVRIHDFGVHEDHAFICMEYVEGWNLAELVEARGGLPMAAVLAIGTPILEALAHAHAHDVLHLDLSPANVLIGRRGSVKLSDFGMAGKRTGLSGGRIIGTPAFLSPEHIAGSPCTRRSDLFSFGSLLYYAARGEPLFDPGPGNSRVTQAIREIEAARSRPPEDRLRSVPSPLGRIARLALEGREAAEIGAALREAWREAGGGSGTEETLVRELGLDGDPLAGRGAENVPEGEALRETYRKLRESGRHREAVDLLEKALRRDPDNPVPRELLAQPPVRPKSGAATVEVGTGAGPGPAGSGPARRGRAAWAAAGGLALILALSAGIRARRGAPSPVSRDVSAAAGAPSPRTAEALVGKAPAPEAAASAMPAAAPTGLEQPGPGRPSPARDPVRTAAPRRPRPPALVLAAPEGTRVSVDDTAEWTAPGPKTGWPLAPGLVNLTLSRPGAARPITSSLFVSADTLYILTLDDEGGFSVTRRRR